MIPYSSINAISLRLCKSLLRNELAIKNLHGQPAKLCFRRMSTEMPVKSGPSTSVADFYAGKSVFITGGTGFIGKAYIQKVLYSCPDVDKIYMLIRANSKEHAKQRVKEMIENSLFKNLQRERPENLKKITPIVGNLTAPNLGISLEEQKLLIDKVSVVIHSAATVNFNEPLQIAYDCNIKGTRTVLDLAKQMINIQAFIHISTLYCAATADRTVIDEIIYPPPHSDTDLDDILKKYANDKFLPSKILAGCPNNYSFTKSFAEDLIMKHHGDLPTAIIRPTVDDLPYPGAIHARSKTTFKILSFLLQLVPAYFIDFWCHIRGMPSKQVYFQKKIIRWQDQNTHFLLGSWRAKSNHVRDLFNTLNYQDKKQFPCDPSEISWDRYLSSYSQGVRNIFLKSQSKQ